MRLSKRQASEHQKAMELVHSDRTLNIDERHFILDNYQESTGALNSLSGAFFTPAGLARDLAIEIPSCGSAVDMCAGIGRLSFAVIDKVKDLVCIEYCREYLEVGRRVVPEAHWVLGDVFDDALYEGLGVLDCAISNPPFGKIKTGTYQGDYSGGMFEYKVIQMASRIAKYGVFIIPQESAPFRYSGEHSFREAISERCRKFMDQTGVVLDHSCGIDTSIYLDDWHGVSPVTEVVVCDFASARNDADVKRTLF